MQVHTRIEAATDPTVEHHIECSKDHPITLLTFVTTTESGGRCTDAVNDCLLFEIEDTAEAVVTEAWEESDGNDFWSIDGEAAREAAVELAACADSLSPEHAPMTSLYHNIPGMSE